MVDPIAAVLQQFNIDGLERAADDPIEALKAELAEAVSSGRTLAAALIRKRLDELADTREKAIKPPDETR